MSTSDMRCDRGDIRQEASPQQSRSSCWKKEKDGASLPVNAPVTRDDAGGPACWICYSNDESEDLISPCDCRGTIQWVHQKCLRKWLASRPLARRELKCANCNFPYRYTARNTSRPLPWKQFVAQADAELLREVCQRIFGCFFITLIHLGYFFLKLHFLISFIIERAGHGPGPLLSRRTTNDGIFHSVPDLYSVSFPAGWFQLAQNRHIDSPSSDASLLSPRARHSAMRRVGGDLSSDPHLHESFPSSLTPEALYGGEQYQPVLAEPFYESSDPTQRARIDALKRYLTDQHSPPKADQHSPDGGKSQTWQQQVYGIFQRYHTPQSKSPPSDESEEMWGESFTSESTKWPDNLLPTLEEHSNMGGQWVEMQEASSPHHDPSSDIEDDIHPSGVTESWSRLYVAFQNIHWFFCVLNLWGVLHFHECLQSSIRTLTAAAGVPPHAGAAMRFLSGLIQINPPLFSKTRLLLVLWMNHHDGPKRILRFFLYSIFTSYVDMAAQGVLDCMSLGFWLGVTRLEVARLQDLAAMRLGEIVILSRHPPPAANSEQSGSCHKPTQANEQSASSHEPLLGGGDQLAKGAFPTEISSREPFAGCSAVPSSATTPVASGTNAVIESASAPAARDNYPLSQESSSLEVTEWPACSWGRLPSEQRLTRRIRSSHPPTSLQRAVE